MRIIAGKYRGRSLATVRDLSVRPTTDRAKQTIFDILYNRIDFDGITVLDLFAGSGSLGLEAISRGAASVTFVDSSREALALLESNARALGCESQCTVYPSDVLRFLKNAKKTYDLAFVDPPYSLEEIGTLPAAVYTSGVVKEGSYVVMEHHRNSVIDIPENMYEMTRKPFGQTIVLILRVTHSPDQSRMSP